MTKNDRPRIDYMPGSAALEALELAAAMYPDARPQALLDRLVITGLCALQWKAPLLIHRQANDLAAYAFSQAGLDDFVRPVSINEGLCTRADDRRNVVSITQIGKVFVG